MNIGTRVYYNQNGLVVFEKSESSGDVSRVDNEIISYIDLPYGDKTLENVLDYHIENGEIVIDKTYIPQSK